MRLSMLKSKIHRATVTEANLDYEGSLTIDQDLLDAAKMLAWEEVHIWDVDNGARLATYILPGPRGSGVVCVNGAAAHLIKPGHKVILATYTSIEEKQARKHQPMVILVDDKNRIRETRHQERPLTLSA